MGEQLAREVRAKSAVNRAKSGDLPRVGEWPYRVTRTDQRFRINLPPNVVDHHDPELVVPYWDAENGYLVLDLEAGDNTSEHK